MNRNIELMRNFVYRNYLIIMKVITSLSLLLFFSSLLTTVERNILVLRIVFHFFRFLSQNIPSSKQHGSDLTLLFSSVFLCVWMCLCTSVFMYFCLYDCAYVYVYVPVCLIVFPVAYVYTCLLVYMYVFDYVCVYLCLYLFMYVCVYVC